MYILLFIIGVLTRNNWTSLLHGFKFQVYDLFIDINMISGKNIDRTGEKHLSYPYPPAFLGNRARKHLLLRMSRLVNIVTDLLICGLLKPGILKCRHSSGPLSSLLRVFTKAACESCGGEEGSTPVSSWTKLGYTPPYGAHGIHNVTQTVSPTCPSYTGAMPVLLQQNLFLIH